MRVIHGLPVSWGPNVTTVYHEEFKGEVAWSPCSRFIAVAKTRAVEVLEAATLKRVHKFETPASPTTPLLSFSPDSRYLIQFSEGELARWDLQTGDPLGAIPSGLDASPVNPFSSTYSVDGRAVAVAWRAQPDNGTFITTYDLVSMTYSRSYHPPGTRIITPIWTHGECLRFATVKRGSIAVWESQFTSTGEPAEVESLPAPEKITDGEYFLFLPALSRLAFTLRGTISVWDAKMSEFLLESGSIQASQDSQTTDPPRFSSGSSFSSDGRFFACMTVDREVYVWKEFPWGSYLLLHQKLRFSTAIVRARPILSPSGESVIASIRPTIHLWTTQDQILSSNLSTQQDGQKFTLTLSPNETLVAFARKRGTIVTLLDLRSSEPRLIIDADGEVLCLGMTDDTIVVVCAKKIVTWNVTAENCTLDAKANISDSIRTTRFSLGSAHILYASLSPDLSCVVILASPLTLGPNRLSICDVSTGREFMSVTTACAQPKFTRGGHQLWDASCFPVEGWKIVQHAEFNFVGFECLTPAEYPSDVVFPWQSTHGYKVADDGWILSPAQKRLLWLPHGWRSHERDRLWSGRFLGLLHGGLPEVVILEFLD